MERKIVRRLASLIEKKKGSAFGLAGRMHKKRKSSRKASHKGMALQLAGAMRHHSSRHHSSRHQSSRHHSSRHQSRRGSALYLNDEDNENHILLGGRRHLYEIDHLVHSRHSTKKHYAKKVGKPRGSNTKLMAITKEAKKLYNQGANGITWIEAIKMASKGEKASSRRSTRKASKKGGRTMKRASRHSSRRY